ncbi:radical SAM protein [bacterium (Candidatus Blackallbacteria) CG17_big_fil_post_rev_8_21_14_2_50_48_46]|uniref:7-carboxy-7-deazaguanine synthase n=1 Tax=bacterium (Candidatus Blackallbacteria) CG17_big_fil_post_rev_8_21_14_2_50_48_46 TaxID=2014261 RepID=A0A2M7G709_9BACT|nr:MAG: radical SAM protein [bacterium (Candidatus Blackallbacteria) CG18_big_fil_WC_8_21_14_2_50_49_26]PIW17476.1 MAG: radical SAM protein [bacterium (Candidatus Blackallbacteria) CG17_big_fil_post_rev_8_21_14_2_50_48_46]PIW48330.1 MAG: radical SAM protein [bacterium (Candidatus Blackallbacteria) CG13_big_fil_rev_8_21_14_2_50_49_14]
MQTLTPAENIARKEHPKQEAYLVEVFSAIQGEGPIVGTRQIFIRFLGCHIQCAYCDTPATHTKQRQCRVERTPGLRDFESIANPVPISDLLQIVESLERFPGLHDSISLTGGEPLQHLRSLKALIPVLKPRFPLYLETDGILWQALEACIQDLEMIGMDMKLPSATGLQAFWEDHARFLTIAARQNVFVKLVFSRNSTLEELDQALEIISGTDRQIPLILQPVTPYGIVRHPPTPEQVLIWQERAKQALKQVRVIPQTHKMIGQI